MCQYILFGENDLVWRKYIMQRPCFVLAAKSVDLLMKRDWGRRSWRRSEILRAYKLLSRMAPVVPELEIYDVVRRSVGGATQRT